jgi:pimeloyl-ACP methyl ester carboxylesterase
MADIVAPESTPQRANRRRFLAMAGALPAAFSDAEGRPVGGDAGMGTRSRGSWYRAGGRFGSPLTASDRGTATFVLIHGAWHSSFCWGEVAERLRACGHRVLAIDLPGHGIHAQYPKSYFEPGQIGFDTEPSPLGQVTLEVAAGAVVAALKQVQGPNRPILVGHSLGGTVITRAAELAPDLIGQLVYLTAFMPTRIPSPAALYDLPEARTEHRVPLTIGDPGKIGAVRYNPRGNLQYLKQLHSVFYQDVPLERFLPYSTALSPDLPLPLWVGETRVSVGRWGSLPRTYIHCTEDRAIPPALQLKMIADADAMTPENRCAVLTLHSSHSPFVSHVEELTSFLVSCESSSRKPAATHT